MKSLTDRTVQAMARKPAAAGKRYDRNDSDVPGLILRVNDRGDVTFMLNTRYPGRAHPERRTLGTYGAATNATARVFTLADARDEARSWRGLVKRGVDPREQADSERRKNLVRRANTFEAMAEDFIADKLGSERKGAEVARDIRREFIPVWGARPVTEITRADVTAIVRTVKQRAPHQARNLLGYARRLFNWGIAQSCYGLEHSPCDKLRPKDLIGKKTRRKRILNDAELLAFWSACDGLGYPYGPLFRLLALTGQRKSEIAEARWSEIDREKKLLIIPADRMKADSAHVVPLCDDAMAIIESLPRFEKGGDYLFSTTSGKKPVNGFSKAKNRLDAAMAATLGAEVPAFVIHDIRRTMRTNLSALPIPQHVCERIIGHAQPELHQVYDLYAFADEKRAGLDLWADRLRSIVTPKPAPTRAGGKVVQLLKKRRA